MALGALMGAAIVAASAPSPAIKPVPARAIASTIASTNGQDLNREFCAVCHGVDTKGGGPAAVALRLQPTDLTRIARKNHGRFDELAVQRVIDGTDTVAAHGTRDMPTWGAVFKSISADEGAARLRLYAILMYVEQVQAR
jgi:mono/diheme cytochrome c family protein